MPVAFTKVIGEHQIIGLWLVETQKIIRRVGNSAALVGYEASHSEACRSLLKAMTGIDNLTILKDEFGKPFIQNSKDFISFSHSGSYAAAVINQQQSVGIDIQQKKDKILSLAAKFCSYEELNYINQVDTIPMLHIIWCAKEAMFKQYGKGAVLFKEHIFVHPFELATKGELTVTFKKDNEETFRFAYECHEEYYLVYSACYL